MMSKPSGHSLRRGAGGMSDARAHNACSDSFARACSNLARLDCAISVSRPVMRESNASDGGYEEDVSGGEASRQTLSKGGDLRQQQASGASLDRIFGHARSLAG